LFAKIFSQIFDSSIAEDYLVRHVFMDLIVLADRDGVVDMTLEAISRRTNVPEDVVRASVTRLLEPDARSRSHLEQGARIRPIDSHRDWGWQIVNYEHYRDVRDEESRKAYFRDYKRSYRQKKENLSTPSPTLSTVVLDCPTCPTLSTKAEAEAEAKAEAKKPSSPSAPRGTRIPEGYQPTKDHISQAKELGIDLRAEFPRFRDYWISKAGKDAVKLDWDATLRNWIRTAAERKPANGKPKQQEFCAGMTFVNPRPQ
jgi:hypothetical protein